jgi:hypothetical protein
LIVLVLLAVLVGVTLFIQGRKQQTVKQAAAPENKAIAQSRSAPSPRNPINTETSQVPAHYEIAPASADLGAVLPAAQFTGKTREAYEAAKHVPVLLAQMPKMPSYCHCDRGMGHKSLHRLF